MIYGLIQNAQADGMGWDSRINEMPVVQIATRRP
jgi:uncharacterized protein (DUF4415 family)